MNVYWWAGHRDFLIAKLIYLNIVIGEMSRLPHVIRAASHL